MFEQWFSTPSVSRNERKTKKIAKKRQNVICWKQRSLKNFSPCPGDHLQKVVENCPPCIWRYVDVHRGRLWENHRRGDVKAGLPDVHGAQVERPLCPTSASPASAAIACVAATATTTAANRQTERRIWKIGGRPSGRGEFTKISLTYATNRSSDLVFVSICHSGVGAGGARTVASGVQGQWRRGRGCKRTLKVLMCRKSGKNLWKSEQKMALNCV